MIFTTKSGDEYGFPVINNWKIIPAFAGVFLVRMDYFEKFYSKYQAVSESGKEFPCCIAGLLFGRGPNAPDERMVYVTNQECWDRELQEEIAIKREVENKSIVNDYLRTIHTSVGKCYSVMSGTELYERYHDKLLVFFVEDIFKDKYINLED